MNAAIEFLTGHASVLLLGSTLLLMLGSGTVLLTSSPVHRQRLSELTILGVLAWLSLACLPLPRLLPAYDFFATSHAVSDGPITATLDELPLVSLKSDARSYPDCLADAESVESVHPDELEAEAELAGLLESTAETQQPSFASTSVNHAASSNISDVLATDNQADVEAAELAPALPGFARLARWLAGTYLFVSGLALAWLAAGYLILWQIRRTASDPPTWVTQLYRSLLPSGADRGPAELIVSTRCCRAVSWGALRPVILLPAELCSQRDPLRMRAVLLHELGHVVQRDAWGNLLFCSALPLLFWNPLYWLLRWQSRMAAELVADDWAAQHTGKEAYVEQLVALASSLSSGGPRLLGATGVVSSPSQFYRRMEMLLTRENRLSNRPSLAWRLSAVGSFGCLIALAAVLAGARPAAADPTNDPLVAPTEESKPAEDRAVDPTESNPRTGLPSIGGSKVSEPADPEPSTDPAVKPEESKAAADAQARSAQDQIKALEAERQALLAQLERVKADVQAAHAAAQVQNQFQQERARKAGAVAELQEAAAKLEVTQKMMAELKRLDDVKDLSDAQRDDLKLRLAKANQDAAVYTQKLAELKQAQAKVDEHANPVISQIPHVNKLFQNRKAATVVRAGEGGRMVQETWTVDESGRPDKLLERTELPATKVSEPVIQHRNIDEWENPVEFNRLRLTRKSESSSSENGQGLRTSKELDLVSLATSYADAVGAVESAKIKVSELEPLVKTNAVSRQEFRTAEAELSAASRKESLLRRIAMVALAGAERELQFAQRLAHDGVAPESALVDAKSKLAILKEILNSKDSAADSNSLRKN